MHGRRLFLSGALLILAAGRSAAAAPAADAASSPAIKLKTLVLVSPNVAHPGGVAYISGTGFSPNTRVAMIVGCPTPRDPLYGSASFDGPHTDGDGSFMAYRIHVPLARAMPTRCSVSADRRAHGRVTLLGESAPLRIVPASTPLPACSVRMCVGVRAFLVRLKSGAQGNIEVLGWPGASVDVTIDRINGRPIHRTSRLQWQGTVTVRVIVAPGLLKGVKARITVHARLGKVSGSAATRFTVVPGGR